MKKYWRIPPRGNAAFVACMEDVLEVYARPYAASRPVLCMDETNKQLIGEVRNKIPAQPGKPERWEHEYVRNGVAQVFLEVEPLTGRRTAHAQGLGPLAPRHAQGTLSAGRARRARHG